MDYQTIKFELNDNIAVITLDRPDVMNAMSTQMRAEIQHAVKEGGRTARCVVLTGQGVRFVRVRTWVTIQATALI